MPPEADWVLLLAKARFRDFFLQGIHELMLIRHPQDNDTMLERQTLQV